MKQLALTQFPTPIMTAIGLLIFFAIFIGVTFWTYRVIAKDRWDEIAARAASDETPRFKQGSK